MTGETLSQVGLALRLKRSTAWVRRQGDYVEGNGETWARYIYSTGRLAGYERVKQKWRPLQ